MNTYKLAFFFGLTILIARVLFGCMAGPTKEQREAAAATAYATELQACVAQFQTATLIDACADGVRARWGRKDGGW